MTNNYVVAGNYHIGALVFKVPSMFSTANFRVHAHDFVTCHYPLHCVLSNQSKIHKK